MGRPVLITGASSGIGLETSVYLAGKGYEVFATMRDGARRQALEAEAEARGVRLRILELDVEKPETIRPAVEDVLRRRGGIYGLVNNAGIAIHGYFEDLSQSEIRKMFRTNVFGTMAVTREVLPHMRRAGQGRIIIMSSIGGRIAGPAGSAYCATKFALEGFGESLYQEVMPFGVSVSMIEPGIVRTKIWEEDRAGAATFPDPDSPYRGWFENQRKWVGRLLESSPNTTEDVARAAYRALAAGKPRFRYVVGDRAKWLLALRRAVPGEVFDKLYFKMIVRRITG